LRDDEERRREMYYGQVYAHNVNNDYEALEDGALDDLANGYYASGSRDKRSLN